MSKGERHDYTNPNTGSEYWWYDRPRNGEWLLHSKETPFSFLPGVSEMPFVFHSREELLNVWEQLLTGEYQLDSD